MKKFFVRLCNVLLIVAALLAYNRQAIANEAADAAAKAEADAINAEVEAAWAAIAAAEEAAEAARVYDDGTYQGTAEGYGGDITVEVTITNDRISAIEIVSAKEEDEAYLAAAENVLTRILNAQSTDVDTITGATFSSGGLLNATAQALESAKKAE